MTRSRHRLFGFALALLPLGLEGADWGPSGHSAITYDLLTSDGYAVEPGLAKVVAMGALGPDVLEFGNSAAHAQSHDPPIGPDGHLSMTRAQYADYQRDQLSKSENWHDYYLRQSIAEMQKPDGDRAKAAFLLGYAMHNSEDFATHQGLPNLVHAEADCVRLLHGQRSVGENGPDADRTRLATAAVLANDDLDAFRKAIGDRNWKLFQGQAVPGAGLGSEVPTPLTRFSDLGDWDPHSGVIPPVGGAPGAESPARSAFDAALAGLLNAGLGQPPDDLKQALYNKFENLALGLNPRQDAMLEILDGLPRGPDDPPPPTKQGAAAEASDLWEYVWAEPNRYNALSGDEQKMIGETDVWRGFLREKLEARRRLLEADRQALRQAADFKIRDLRQRIRLIESNMNSVREADNRVAIERVKWQEKWADYNAVAQLGPPKVDRVAREAAVKQAREERADDAEEVFGRVVLGIGTLGLSELAIAASNDDSSYDASSSSSSSNASSGRENRSSRSSDNSSFQFRSSTYDQLSSGNIGW